MSIHLSRISKAHNAQNMKISLKKLNESRGIKFRKMFTPSIEMTRKKCKMNQMTKLKSFLKTPGFNRNSTVCLHLRKHLLSNRQRDLMASFIRLSKKVSYSRRLIFTHSLIRKVISMKIDSTPRLVSTKLVCKELKVTTTMPCNLLKMRKPESTMLLLAIESIRKVWIRLLPSNLVMDFNPARVSNLTILTAPSIIILSLDHLELRLVTGKP